MRSLLPVTLLALSAVVLVVANGCGDSADRSASPPAVTGAAGTSGASGAGGTTTAEPIFCDDSVLAKYTSPPGAGQPPGPSSSAAPGDGAPTQYAIRSYFLGDTTFDGVPTPNAWKSLGFDLDGFSSDRDFGCHCKAVTRQAKTDIRTGGMDGIDNSFGNIIIAQQTIPLNNPSDTASQGIQAGQGSLLIAFSDLGTSPSYESVKAQVIPVRMPTGVMPQLTEDDSWSPFAGTTMPAVTYDGGWVTDDTWVSAPSEATLVVVTLGMKLSIQRLTITAKLSRDRTRIERGIIGGVMETSVFIDSFRELAASRGLCGDALLSITEQLRAASDMPTTGAHDPTIPCNAISIGLGFTATRTGPLGPALAPDTAPSRCGN